MNGEAQVRGQAWQISRRGETARSGAKQLSCAIVHGQDPLALHDCPLKLFGPACPLTHQRSIVPNITLQKLQPSPIINDKLKRSTERYRIEPIATEPNSSIQWRGNIQQRRSSACWRRPPNWTSPPASSSAAAPSPRGEPSRGDGRGAGRRHCACTSTTPRP